MSADEQPPEPAPIRAGFCAIVGLPNVGKSTLLNRVLDRRLAAVSPKPQTTRNRILGVLNATLPDAAGDAAGPAAVPAPTTAQVAFLDTPGIQQGSGALRRYMREEALSAAGDADVALLVVDAADPRGRGPARLAEPDAAALAAAIRRVPVVVALNKVDRVAKPELLPLIEAWHAWAAAPPASADAASSPAPGREAEIVPISALTGDGLGPLVAAIARRLPVGPALFPPDLVTDRAERFLAGELIREQLFHQLGKELPYAAAVVVESFEDRDRDIVVGAVIVVERDSQKAIVVGKGGQRVKQLGIAAREALADLFRCPVHLNLHVKVVPDWSRGERALRDLGFEAPGRPDDRRSR